MIDAKDSPNDEHSERVATFVRRLAEAAGWVPARVALLAEAAQIHDVGKICVPQEVLRKPAALTPEEYELVKAHAAVGADMAREALSGSGSTTSASTAPAIRAGSPEPRSPRAPICSRSPTAGMR